MKKTNVKLPHLESLCTELGKILGNAMPEGVGFCLQIFTFGEGGYMTYISNAQRADMLKAMRESIRIIEGGIDQPPGGPEWGEA